MQTNAKRNTMACGETDSKESPYMRGAQNSETTTG
jgi:hypothetical protein